jgi:hypothetical protein
LRSPRAPALEVKNKCLAQEDSATKKPYARLAAVWQQKTGDINNKRLMDYD